MPVLGALRAPLIERVGYALNHFPNLDGKPEGFDEEIFDLLFSSAELHNFAPEDRFKYHNDMTTERDIKNQIDFAYDKGLAAGEVRGEARGRQEGKEEGFALANEQNASKMKALGLPAETILEVTGIIRNVYQSFSFLPRICSAGTPGSPKKLFRA